MMLETRCLQSFPYYEFFLLLKWSTLIFKDFHHIGYLPCRHTWMVSLDLPSLGHPFIKVWLLIKFSIYFKLAFSQAFLTSAGNIVIPTKVLGYGTKCDNSKPYYTKLGNASFISFTTNFETLCKPFPILFSESSYPFRSFFICLIR